MGLRFESIACWYVLYVTPQQFTASIISCIHCASLEELGTQSAWTSGLLLDHSKFKWNNTDDPRLDSGMWPIGARFRHSMKTSHILNHPPKPYLAPWLHIAFQPIALRTWFSSRILLCGLVLPCQCNLYSHSSQVTPYKLSVCHWIWSPYHPCEVHLACMTLCFTDGETRALRGNGLTKNHPVDWC